ncbi:MAG: hypothetical protein ACHBN1_17300 [Heteroscytonema crispum UTEX LB 1556]
MVGGWWLIVHRSRVNSSWFIENSNTKHQLSTGNHPLPTTYYPLPTTYAPTTYHPPTTNPQHPTLFI